MENDRIMAGAAWLAVAHCAAYLEVGSQVEVSGETFKMAAAIDALPGSVVVEGAT